MKRLSLGLLVLVCGLGLLVGAHAYVAQRMVVEPGIADPWRTLALCGIALGALSLVLQPMGERWLELPASRCIAWPASLWMGFAFLVLVQLLASDALLWLAGSVARAATGSSVEPGATAGVRAALVAGVALVAGAMALRNGLAPPQVERVEIALSRWPHALDGLRIVQISDVHIGPILGRNFAAHVTERVNALRPDLIAVTGDLADGSAEKLASEVAPFSALAAPLGVYFVVGNHDHYSGARAWAAKAADLGMRVLRNERVSLEARGEHFDLVGVDDHRGDIFGADGGEDLDAALAGRDMRLPALLLAHDPSTFKRAHADGIDLQLSGHTHGGQIFPFHWFVRAVIPFVAGRYRCGDAELYVSRGTGFWGPPMRLGSPAEITEIVLRAPH
ncbi:MAG: metallophosphoesterase [Deltaproteobacteria bacterium]|nr:metallophosphoesterase [Deltaproteobacteria bacterium]